MPRTIWTSHWTHGPHRLTEPAKPAEPRQLTVSITEFTTHRPWHALGVAASARRLRDTWPDTEGAVGLLLWIHPHPLRPVTGSLSVWRDPTALHGFVSRPDHRVIVRDYRDRGTVRSATVTLPAADLHTAWQWARPLLTGQQSWPVA
ncbi:hypothetical protein ABH931_002636 [Streptacidiphilus sp. MAP12-33]|uniref:hypothetical protein n=1 Tax=Streptacidiphilus sp. MAP12-33 TaxID=3156266 RepID=UPI0035156C8C